MSTISQPLHGAVDTVTGINRALYGKNYRMLKRYRLRKAAARGVHGNLPLARLKALDSELFARVARSDIPGLGPFLPRLTRVANRSVLWMLFSVVLWGTRRRDARRAATRGMLSIALTSAIVNLPIKLLFRRARPPLDDVPVIRRLARVPLSSSFPSGHSASAFAYAVGASTEMPLLAPMLVPTAGLVGLSRVYTGVHYPVDVAVGAGLGAGIAFATRRFWPVPPEGIPEVELQWMSDYAEASTDGAGLTVVVNDESGSPLSVDHADAIESRLPQARVVRIEDASQLREALEEAAESSHAIGVCGGDGSVNVAAAVALDHQKPLLVIPGGTLNHLAHAIGVEDVDASIKAVRKGEVVGIDVATIDDHPFVNTASFGSYVELVDARERLEGRIGKWPAVAFALGHVLMNSEPIDVELDGKRARIWMAFVGNCRYHPSGFAPSWREKLDDEMLDVRYVDAAAPFARFRLLLAVLTGRLGRSRVYKQQLVKSVHVRSLEGPLRLARDGETFQGSEDFVIEKMPKRLGVYAPQVV
jgi:diacylglycerol kinase family enzyme/membrane-associated phospholipid phosphatase